mmetsp:Transcript_19016/g.47386  ORF Transcript_19016/g.47386 Transcript_19016/m.47386 type:complete len:271 (+) Transcript_19016:1583-2395(+)
MVAARIMVLYTPKNCSRERLPRNELWIVDAAAWYMPQRVQNAAHTPDSAVLNMGSTSNSSFLVGKFMTNSTAASMPALGSSTEPTSFSPVSGDVHTNSASAYLKWLMARVYTMILCCARARTAALANLSRTSGNDATTSWMSARDRHSSVAYDSVEAPYGRGESSGCHRQSSPRQCPLVKMRLKPPTMPRSTMNMVAGGSCRSMTLSSGQYAVLLMASDICVYSFSSQLRNSAMVCSQLPLICTATSPCSTGLMSLTSECQSSSPWCRNL